MAAYLTGTAILKPGVVANAHVLDFLAIRIQYLRCTIGLVCFWFHQFCRSFSRHLDHGYSRPTLAVAVDTTNDGTDNVRGGAQLLHTKRKHCAFGSVGLVDLSVLCRILSRNGVSKLSIAAYLSGHKLT